MAITYTRARADWQDDEAGGTPILAANLDTIEAGLDAIYKLVNAAGDIVTGSANDTLERLAIGANDELLSVNAGALDYRKIVNAMVDSAAAIAYSKLNLAGGIVNADVSASAAIDLSKLGAPAWTNYTPTWGGSGGTAPTLGNGILLGRYIKIGRLVVCSISLIMGSTTTFGSGTFYTWNLPVNAAASQPGVYGVVRAKDASAASVTSGALGQGTDTSNVVGWTNGTPGVLYGPTTPITWANNDTFEALGVYEAAS